MGVMRIELEIDELVLDAFEPRDGHRLADALERQLVMDMSRAWIDRWAGSGRPPPEIPVIEVDPFRAVGLRSEIVGVRTGSAIATALGQAFSDASRGRGAG
jgi:hypothetical protein